LVVGKKAAGKRRSIGEKEGETTDHRHTEKITETPEAFDLVRVRRGKD